MKRNLHAGIMQSGGFSLKPFTDDELYEIHLATLEVLSDVGIFVDDEEALDIFDGGGATIDRKNKRVKIPNYIVEDATRSLPSKLVLSGRNPKDDVVIEGNRVCFTNFGEAVKVIDPYTGERRASTKADLVEATILSDYLSEIDVFERPLSALDVPQSVLNIHNAEAILSNTTKHSFLGPANQMQAKKIIDMGAAIAGSKEKFRARPLFTFNVCPVSPLKLLKGITEVIIEGAKNGMPVNVLSMALAGASAPVTLAGAIVIHNAEVLSGLVLNQLTCKGAPGFYGSSTTCLDLRHGVATVGSPEMGMINAAVAQLAKFYQVPSWVAGG